MSMNEQNREGSENNADFTSPSQEIQQAFQAKNEIIPTQAVEEDRRRLTRVRKRSKS